MSKTILRSLITKLALSLSLILTSAVVWSASAQTSEPPLTNAAVIKLVRAGFKEKTVIAIIHSRPNRFNLDPDRLIDLKRNGVSENIILAMLSQNDSFVFNEDDWTADSVLGDSRKNEKDGGGSGIFGNSSGSRSQSSGRGQMGGSDGETQTTGSATVRILRPPAEAGGAPIKMERTPTLNNDSVIKLVEAGFSEGTIIKRIEESPADFDLSVPKLEELRRRRVTEPIILAMTAAMDDGTKPVGSSRNSTRTKGN
ncbi:MAG TPA: hypothetical protein VLL54_05765 [Pyrinomonadaceae bacterium]|nr:hypothetical protein [Pyrinomonadaceae bacterium]